MSVTSLMRGEMAVAMAVALVLALVLLALRPADRAATRNQLVLLGVCALAEIADGVGITMGWRGAAAVAADAASVLVGLVLIRLVVLALFRVVLPALGAAPARIVEDVATAAAFVGWGLAWLRLAGVDPSSLVASSAVITAVVAFSMQDTLGNVLGGLVLQFDSSLAVGNWVRIDDISGRVTEVRWRHTAIETRNGETVIIPNGWLVKNRFTLVATRAGAGGRWRRWLRFNVDLAAAPREVCETLEEAVRAAAIDNVASDPAPSAVLLEVGPRYGSYALRYWLVDPGPDDPTDSVVRMHALAALKRHGMKLGVPYSEQLTIDDDEEHRTASAARERERRLRALAGVELFTPLSAAEREELADHLVYAPFVAGDVMTRQGAVAHWLYLIVSGEALVSTDGPEGHHDIGTLEAGSVFGEMGMMTGAARSATVTAASDVVCYRLDKAGFETVIRKRPDVAEAMSRILAARQTDLHDRLAAHQAAQHPRAAHADILAGIRAFFGIAAPHEAPRAPVRRA